AEHMNSVPGVRGGYQAANVMGRRRVDRLPALLVHDGDRLRSNGLFSQPDLGTVNTAEDVGAPLAIGDLDTILRTNPRAVEGTARIRGTADRKSHGDHQD